MFFNYASLNSLILNFNLGWFSFERLLCILFTCSLFNVVGIKTGNSIFSSLLMMIRSFSVKGLIPLINSDI